MHLRIRFFFCCFALLFCLPACDYSNTHISETAVTRITIQDQSGRQWDITQAVYRYGFDRDGFKFGLGPIAPIVSPPLAGAGDAGFPPGTETFDIIGIVRAADARAYRLDDLLDVEVVDDVIGGEPVAVVHRPLVGAPSVCARVLDGDTLTIAASGWVYDDESVLFDNESGSMWYRLGTDGTLTCIAGSRFEAELPARPASVSPWDTWVASHPATTFMLRP